MLHKWIEVVWMDRWVVVFWIVGWMDASLLGEATLLHLSLFSGHKHAIDTK